MPMPARSWAMFDATNSAIHTALILVFQPLYLSALLSSRRKLPLSPFSQSQFFSSAPFLNALTALFHLLPCNYHPQQASVCRHVGSQPQQAIQTMQTRLWILPFHQLTSHQWSKCHGCHVGCPVRQNRLRFPWAFSIRMK
jgi:hypothetical protein